EVVETRLAAARPVADVVGMEEAAVVAAGGATAAGAGAPGSAPRDPGGSFSSVPAGAAPLPVARPRHGGVAPQAASGLGGARRAVLQDAGAALVVAAREGGCVDVDDDLIAIATAAGLGGGERRVGQCDERLRSRRPRFRGTAAAGERVPGSLERAQQQ